MINNIVFSLLVGSFWYQHKPISMFEEQSIKSIGCMPTLHPTNTKLSNHLKNPPQNQTLIEGYYCYYYIILDLPCSFRILTSSVFKKYTSQSQPKIYIVSWFIVVWSLGFISIMLTVIRVNQSLHQVGLPIKWLTIVLLKILESLPLHKL
jgi:hypothetical protein